jgi:hypothetical protein
MINAFFLLGLLVVAAYAWQRFNEPSFTDAKALPHTLVPLRYLFLRPAYQRARLFYVVISLTLYYLLVWPGPSIVPVLGDLGIKDFPPSAWPLLIALLLVGLVPNANVKWLTLVEDWLRRQVHEWFLVPGGVEQTIGVLEDAVYEPPPSQLNAVPSPRREMLRDDLKRPRSSLRYRLARARMLVESLKQMGAGAAHPLRRAAFAPFEEDFKAICVTCRALERDIVPLGGNDANEETEENLTRSVDDLLQRIYAYISWGIRYQANSGQEVDQTLEDLGFRVPIRGGHSLFDIVLPAVLLVALITVVFWVTYDAVSRLMGASSPTVSESVVSALTSAMAASIMYGCAVHIALKQRQAQIEQKVWRRGSPLCLIPLAARAGLVTWLVIIVSTVLWQQSAAWHSVVGLAQLANSVANGADRPPTAEWSFLPSIIVTALPWLLAGVTVSAVLASRLGGDVRQTGRSHRLHDAFLMGGALALAAAAAQLIQTSLSDFVFHEEPPSPSLVPIIGLAGFACGAVIGFMVPQACRANIVTPPNRDEAGALRDLLGRAEAVLDSKTAAENWVFTPRNDLDGITPAEAVQYKGFATGVWRRLDDDASRQGKVRPSPTDPLLPTPFDGSLGADNSASITLVPDRNAGTYARVKELYTSTAGRVSI